MIDKKVEELELKLNALTIRVEELEKTNIFLMEKTKCLDTQAYKNTLPQTWVKKDGSVISSLDSKVGNE